MVEFFYGSRCHQFKLQKRSRLPRNFVKTRRGSVVFKLACSWRSLQRKKGFVCFSKANTVGMVGFWRCRWVCTCWKRLWRASFSGSTVKENLIFFRVYSWAHQIFVLSGKSQICWSEAKSWAGVPSKRRPQPLANSVSPQNKSPLSSGCRGGK